MWIFLFWMKDLLIIPNQYMRSLQHCVAVGRIGCPARFTAGWPGLLIVLTFWLAWLHICMIFVGWVGSSTHTWASDHWRPMWRWRWTLLCFFIGRANKLKKYPRLCSQFYITFLIVVCAYRLLLVFISSIKLCLDSGCDFGFPSLIYQGPWETTKQNTFVKQYTVCTVGLGAITSVWLCHGDSSEGHSCWRAVGAYIAA